MALKVVLFKRPRTKAVPVKRRKLKVALWIVGLLVLWLIIANTILNVPLGPGRIYSAEVEDGKCYFYQPYHVGGFEFEHIFYVTPDFSQGDTCGDALERIIRNRQK